VFVDARSFTKPTKVHQDRAAECCCQELATRRVWNVVELQYDEAMCEKPLVAVDLYTAVAAHKALFLDYAFL
jgi:hypothetical protein